MIEKQLPYKVLDEKRFLFRIQELLEYEDFDRTLILTNWVLARPDLSKETRATTLAFQARTFMLLGQLQEAADTIDQAKALALTIEVITVALELLLHAEEPHQARTYLEAHWDILQKDDRSLILTARILLACKEVEPALKLLKEISKQDAPPRGTFNLLAETLFQYFGGFVALDEARRAALGGYPTPRDMILYGQTLAEVGRPHESFAAFETALFLKPDNVAPFLGTFHALVKLRCYQHAENILNLLLQNNVSSPYLIIEIARGLLIFGRSEEAANLTQNAIQQQQQQQQQQQPTINPHILVATAMTFLFEGLVDEAKSYLQRIDLQKHLNDEYIQRTYAEYIVLSSGDISKAWLVLLPFLKGSGPNFPTSIPMYQKDTTLRVGMRLLIRLCQPFRFIGYIPWFIEKGLKVSVLVLEDHKLFVEKILPPELILTTEECHPENFDYIIDDLVLPTITSQVSWYNSIQYRPTKKIGLALLQEEGIGPGVDLPESLEQEILHLFQKQGYKVIFIDEKNDPKRILTTLDSLQGVILSESLFVDYTAALGIPTVFVGCLLVDSFWRSPTIQDFYPTVRVVLQDKYGDWSGVVEKVVQAFEQLQEQAQLSQDEPTLLISDASSTIPD